MKVEYNLSDTKKALCSFMMLLNFATRAGIHFQVNHISRSSVE